VGASGDGLTPRSRWEKQAGEGKEGETIAPSWRGCMGRAADTPLLVK
jgi:hypothetical protein